MIFYYELYFNTSSEDESRAMTLIITDYEYSDWKRIILLFFSVFIFVIFISLHILRSEAHKISLKFIFISNTIIVILSEHLVLSAYFVIAAAVSDFSSYSICFIYTTKSHHQQDVCLSEKLIHWNIFYFFHFYIFHCCSAVYSVYVSFCFQVCWSISFQWNKHYWLSWDIKNHHSES